MPEASEQRSYIRLKNGCELSYKYLDSEKIYHGVCTSISAAGIFFTTDHTIESGKALEIHFTAKSLFTRAMTAFIEVVRSTPLKKQLLKKQLIEIDGTIKSIKAN